MSNICEPDAAVVATAKSFVPQILESADRIEADRRLPDDLVNAFRTAGLLRLFLPGALGGTEASPLTVIAVAEELGKADASTAWAVNVANQAAWLTSRLEPERAQQLINRDSIVLGSGIQSGSATLVDGGYRVSGRWAFASGAPHATVFSAVTPDTSRPAGSSITLFLPRADCRVLDTWYTTGMRGTGSHDFEVNEAFVASGLSFVSGTPSVSPSPLYAVPYLRFIGRGGLALGVARKALDAFIELAGSKKQMASTVRLAEQERFQIALAEAEAEWQSARAWLLASTEAVWEALVEEGSAPYADRSAMSLATAHAAQSALRVVQTVYRLGGTSSSRSTWVLDRCLRDLLTASADISVGAVMFAQAGKDLMGVGPRSVML